MHEYSLNSHNRLVAIYLIATISGFLAAYVTHYTQTLSHITDLPLAAPSGVLVFFLVFWTFDHFIWRWRLWFWLGLIQVPNIRGRWKGALHTSKDNFINSIPIELSVTQTYTKIFIQLDSDTSFSQSHMAAIKMLDQTSYEIRWEYFAQPKTGPESGFRHYGVTYMRLRGKGGNFKKKQSADYYTEFDRDTSGRITLEPA